MAEKVDVLICGSGSAGLSAALFLAKYGVKCKILEKRDGPLTSGQADGVQCRTVEILDYFGKGPEALREGCHIKETCFWSAAEHGNLERKTRSPDTAPGTSHMPHIILNQARINDFLLQAMSEANNQEVDYGHEIQQVHVDKELALNPDAYPITVTSIKDAKEQTFKAKFLLGSDGAHSKVRKSLGIQMKGDSTDRVWGVVDTYPRTDFPDIRKKCFLSTRHGSIVVIPREGGYLVRFYIELSPETRAGDVALDGLEKTTQEIFHPYPIKFTEVTWWSAYSIGQRQANAFAKNYRAFLAGDACHTHSPKAGQGMNVSLQDGYNWGWKAAMAIKKLADPGILKTYVLERQKVATDLIDFDRYWSKLVSETPPDESSDSRGELSKAFEKSRAYTAGITAKYEDSMITSAKKSDQSLAKHAIVGSRLASTRVTRMADAKPMHLSDAMPADGRWRIIIFPGDVSEPSSAQRLWDYGVFLDSNEGPNHFFSTAVGEFEHLIETFVILSGKRHSVDYPDLHEYFWPATGDRHLRNLYRVFFDDQAHYEYGTMQMETYAFYGVDPKIGAVLAIRPDQHVSMVLGVDDHQTLTSFFAGFAP